MTRGGDLKRSGLVFACALGALILASEKEVQAQASEDFGSRLGVRRGGEVSYEPEGPGVLFGALDPAVKNWFVPQELFNEYQWKQWEYSNYARTHYERYVNTSLEGDYFYDLYGNYITRGKLIYDWRVEAPRVAGSNLFKSDQYASWFSRLVVASDSKGQYYYAATIGDAIRTTLTPMTFSKPTFSGIQFDVATDKYQATLLASRPSAPGVTGTLVSGAARERSNDTNLLGGRATASIGDFLTIGATYVNGFNAQTKNQSFEGNPFRGTLTEGENQDITRLEIRLSDDSPEDGEAGAALFQEEIIITDVEGERRSNRRRMDGNPILSFEPTIQGGFQREGYLSADGNETIILIYDLEGPDYKAAYGPAPDRIRRVEFVLLVANDYRIELTSDQQSNRNDQPVVLSTATPERAIRADGNVKDGSNQRFVQLDYGLPVANEIYGLTVELQDVMGLYVSGEFDRNRQHSRYPRRGQRDVTEHAHSLITADAMWLNMYKRSYPWYVFGEAYSVDPNYSTTTYIVGPQNDLGEIYYDDEKQFLYEFVDDNDDQDRYPDWYRRGFTKDNEVFPGWDQNNDFIVDFNQNDNLRRPNLTPDYEEPFLRYNSDRPEFLFGVDMNNNMVVDRFENDDQPDYLYGRDRRGYNAYAGTHLGSGNARITFGYLNEWQLADDRSNESAYMMLTYERSFPRLGRLRFYNHGRRVRDDIRDDVILWVLREGSRGDFVPFADPLAARDVWANTVFCSWDLTTERLRLRNRIKHEIFQQVDLEERPVEQQDIRETSGFFGVINKADYVFDVGRIRLQPRWKNEILRQRTPDPQNTITPSTTEVRELVSLMVKVPFLSHSEIETGVELYWVEQLREKLENDPLRSDRNEVVYAAQVTNNSAYVGYDLWTQAGMSVSRVNRATTDKTLTETRMFITVYAGFGE